MTQFPANTIIDTASLGTIPALPAVRPSPVAGTPRYESHPSWSGTRSFESAQTNRLNQAHWRDAQDQSVNVWLLSQLATMRARSAYECRQNGMVLGMINTHADDIVGSDGPTLQVLSDNDAYNTALERAWQDWFSAPTPRPNVSGVAMLKLWVRSLWKGGEYLAQLVSIKDEERRLALRVQPFHPRWLATPIGMTGDPNVFMGIRFDHDGRPTQYYRTTPRPLPTQQGQLAQYYPVSAEMIIHEFVLEEEEQARGIPWLNTGLQPAADTRDFDDQTMDAARQAADQSGMMYTEHTDVELWTAPESSTVERRTWKMCPPGWKPFVYAATQPPVQYIDYRSERQRELGRPVGMPLFMIRLDSSKSNYAAARMDYQSYARAVACLQTWFSGSEKSCGTLNRLVDEVALEMRLIDPVLRHRPEKVRYKWQWPTRPHVDREKEAKADKIGLELPQPTTTVTDVLAARGETLESHIATRVREQKLLAAAGLIDEPEPVEVEDDDDATDETQVGFAQKVKADA